MCRLTAYAGGPLTAEALVFGGTHSLLEQSYVPRELLHGHVNGDGYGWCGTEALRPFGPVVLARSGRTKTFVLSSRASPPARSSLRFVTPRPASPSPEGISHSSTGGGVSS